MRILVTGHSGFVGSALVRLLLGAGYVLSLAGRTANADPNRAFRSFAVGNIGPSTEWRPALEECEAVVHLAAQVPAPGSSGTLMREVNDLGTARLVEQAIVTGVKRFVLLSSVFAGVDHSSDTVIDERFPSAPSTSYGRSKLAAESHVIAFAGSGRCGIALRSPIVYGATAAGNWDLLQRLAASGMPLPFGAVRNRRTLIAVENLTDALLKLVSLPHEALQPGVYMVSDNETMSLAEMLCYLRSGMGLPQRLLPVSPILLETALSILNRKAVAKSLLGNLEINSALFRHTFDWAPKISAPEAIARSGEAFIRGDAAKQEPAQDQ